MLLEVCFLIIFWSWVASAVWFLRMTFLPRLPLTQTPEAFHLPSETVKFTATDGLPLVGWKIPGHPNRPWIILCHGLGTNRRSHPGRPHPESQPIGRRYIPQKRNLGQR